MAQDAEVVQEVKAPRNKKRLIVAVAVALVIVLAVAVAAAALLLGGGGKENKRADRKNAPQQPQKTVLVPFQEKFTVNLRSADGRAHYLQVPMLHMEVVDPAVAGRLEEIKPKVSDRISSLLRSKDMQTMLEPGSDIRLKEELKQVVNEALGVSDEGQGVVEVILPQSFIVQ